jgi:hypothetical protein
MKTITNGLHGLGAAGLALGCLLSTSAHADFSKPDPSIASRLKASFNSRSAESCAPTAPIETSLNFASTPRLGEPVTVNFDVTAFEKGVNAEVRFEITEGIQFAGLGRETGELDKNRGYRFSRQLVFTHPGEYKVIAQVIAGVPEYRFGRRETIYVQASGAGIRHSKRPFNATNSDSPNGGVQRDYGALSHLISGGRGQLALPEVEFPKVDPNGKPLDGGESSGGPDVPTTVYGYWRYLHTDGTFHWGYGAQAQAWDQDDFSADDFLGSVIVNSVGYYEIDFDNNSDGGVEPGTADVYISWVTDNSEVQVHNASDTVYRNSTGVIFPNIAGGSHNVGTYNPLGSGIRANQLEDELTRGWSDGVGFGHNAHKTFCEWYPGSTDGAYYRRSEDRIYINDDHVSSIDVTLHEYGHSYHDSFNGEDDWPPGAGGNHSFTGHYTDGLALTEGYATYFSCAAQGDDRWYDDLDPNNLIHFDCDANWDGNGVANGNSDNLSNNPNWGYDTESAVLSFLLDIDDARNSPTDPFDWYEMNYQEIHDVFFNHMVSGHHLYSIRDFYAGWYARNHPYRPKMNGQMMVHGMKQGIDRPALGLSVGLDIYAGTWYFGGYGRGSFTAMNYGSQNYALNQLYVWLTNPDGETCFGGFGGDGNNAVIPSGGTRAIFKSSDQTGMNVAGGSPPTAPYGVYTVRAGHYRSDNVWQLLDPAESGTNTSTTVTVNEDTTAPTVTSQDDGNYQFSRTSIHLTATAVEAQSTIRSFWVRLGTTPGGNNIMPFTEYPQNNDPTFDEVINFAQVAYGTTIYATVVARNIEGLDGWSDTNGIEVVSPEIAPTTFTRTRGTMVGGNNVSFVQNSDNQRMEIQPGIVFSTAQDPVELVFAATVPVMPLSSINLKVESNATAAAVRLKIDMYDYDAGQWVEVRNTASTTTDTTYQHLRNDWDRWISPGGTVRARIRYKAEGPVFSYPWTGRLDWVHWTLAD